VIPLYITYVIYKWVTNNSRVATHYQQYPNVVVAKNPHWLMGDYNDEDEESYEMDFHVDSITENPDTDIIVRFDYRLPTVFLCSHKAIKEFKALFPTKIDRDNKEALTFGKIYPKCLEMSRTNNSWKKRSDAYFKHGAIKKPQVLISKMIYVLEDYISEWKTGQNIDFIDEFSGVMQDIILTVIFGDKFVETIGNCSYKAKDGTCKMMPFGDMLFQVQEDTEENGDSWFSALFPFVVTKNLMEPYKTDQENIDTLHKTIKNYMTKDGKNDIFDFKIINGEFNDNKNLNISPTEYIHDLLNVADAGDASLTFSIPTCLLYLKRNPKVLKKLRAELKSSGIEKETMRRDAFVSERGQKLLNE
jgi:hypothetical protein